MWPDPPKKALCHTRPFGVTYDKYRIARWYDSLECRLVSEAQGVILHLVVASALQLRRYAKRSFSEPFEISIPSAGISLTILMNL